MAGAEEAIGMSVTNLNFVFKILILYWNIHVNVQVHWIVSETENQVFLLQIYTVILCRDAFRVSCPGSTK